MGATLTGWVGRSVERVENAAMLAGRERYIDGLPVRPDGAHVLTVEKLAPELGKLSVLQEAFHRRHGLQCGLCKPGILIALDCFLCAHPEPDEEAHLAGHLCRCIGYAAIVSAALDAAADMWGRPAHV